MGICANALILCKAANCAACDHAHNMDKCPKAQLDSMGFPSFTKALEVYKTGPASEHSKKNLECIVRRGLRLMGISPETSTIGVMEEDFERLITELRGEDKSDYTIATYLGAFRSLGSRRLKSIYKRSGIRSPMFELPDFTPSRKPVKILTVEQDVWLYTYIHECRRAALSDETSKRLRAGYRNKFLALFFSRCFAMRNGDIGLLKWGNIIKTDEGYILKYSPHKTPWKTSDILIDERSLALLRPFMGSDNEFVLTNKYKARTFNGLWRSVNLELKKHGIGEDDSKVSYQLRKLRISEAYAEGGFAMATAIGMNTPHVEEKHYLGQSKYRGRGAVAA